MERKYIVGIVAVLAVVGGLMAFVVGLPFGKATITSVSGPSKADSGSEINLCMNVKNEQPFKVDYMVEAGVVPQSVAENWFPSTLSLFGGNRGGQCCSGQDNIRDKWISLGPYGSKRVCLGVNTPYEGIEDKCGTTGYWKENEPYTKYYLVANHCHYREGEQVEKFEMYDVETKGLAIPQANCPWYDPRCWF